MNPKLRKEMGMVLRAKPKANKDVAMQFNSAIKWPNVFLVLQLHLSCLL